MIELFGENRRNLITRTNSILGGLTIFLVISIEIERSKKNFSIEILQQKPREHQTLRQK